MGHEGARQVRLCACPSHPSSPRQCRRWLPDLEEDHEFRRCRRRLLLLLRAHAHEGQLHEGDVRGLEGDVRLLDPRPVETKPPFQEFTDYLAATKAVPTAY